MTARKKNRKGSEELNRETSSVKRNPVDLSGDASVGSAMESSRPTERRLAKKARAKDEVFRMPNEIVLGLMLLVIPLAGTLLTLSLSGILSQVALVQGHNP